MLFWGSWLILASTTCPSQCHCVGGSGNSGPYHCCCGGCCHHCLGCGRSSRGTDSGRSGLLLPRVWGWPHWCFSWDSTGKREDGFLHRPFWSWCWAGVDLPVRSLLDCSFASPLARNSRLYFFFLMPLGSSRLRASPQSSLAYMGGQKKIQELNLASFLPSWDS